MHPASYKPETLVMGATEEVVRRKARVLTAFMSQEEAQGFANSFACDRAGFLTAWAASVAKGLVETDPRPSPRVEELPAEAVPHVSQLTSNPLFLLNYGSNVEVKMVELGKLIAMQHWVDTHVSVGVHGIKLQEETNIQHLLGTCLNPADLRPTTDTRWSRTVLGPPGQPIVCILTGHSLEASYGLRDVRQDFLNNSVGLLFGANSNLMLVREHGGRYVLAQGYHRAWMLRSRGVEMVPVVVMHLPSSNDLTAPGFISLHHITSNRPPTIDDFMNPDVSVDADVRAMMASVKITVERSLVPRLL
jgi:hypothetical protein